LYAIGFRYSFTPLAGVLFTFPSRYLFTIGRQGVFSLIQWSGQIHAEFHVHRITWDSSRGKTGFRAPGYHGLWPIFPDCYTNQSSSHIKVPQPRKDKSLRFRLLRFRSPLLTESHSFSSPGVTEMFHFTPSCFNWTMNSSRDTGRLKPVGCPIRKSTDQRLLAAPRGLSQLATSFIASWHQGIHRLHLVA
jgi:hypothetical protein